MIACLLALALAEPTLPERELTALSGEPLASGPGLVLVSFKRSHAEDVEAWTVAMASHPWRQLAVVGELGRTSRWIVTTAMKGSYDEAREARTALVLEAPEPWVAALELPDDAAIGAFVVDAEGAVRWSHLGPPTDEAIAAATTALEAL